jgi:YgiT-type zinc finger domain-containing protein
MAIIRITTDTSQHAGCGGLLAMSQEAPEYIIEYNGLETRIPGVEMVCLRCGERIRSQEQVEGGEQ